MPTEAMRSICDST